MIKKLALLILTFLLLISTAVSAQNLIYDSENVSNSIKRLQELGIFNYESMESQEVFLNQNVSREELAKIICKTLMLKDETISSVEKADFSDINTSNSPKYINALASLEIVKGNPDGTFSPIKQTSYEEAITVLIRALGYKEIFFPGEWPHNFISKANDLNITENISMEPSDFITRSTLAVLISNTLDCKPLVKEETEDSINWAESDKTLLEIINENK